jgi:hypothetical protein
MFCEKNVHGGLFYYNIRVSLFHYAGLVYNQEVFYGVFYEVCVYVTVCLKAYRYIGIFIIFLTSPLFLHIYPPTYSIGVFHRDLKPGNILGMWAIYSEYRLCINGHLNYNVIHRWMGIIYSIWKGMMAWCRLQGKMLLTNVIIPNVRVRVRVSILKYKYYLWYYLFY